jgi:mannan endo-1,6-alpha-mannosidase
MSAAEMKFPNPDPKKPSWLSLAQAVFNRQASRWDTDHCGGGLRWQFMSFNNGWMDKNSISNGCFFQLAARLAQYTKNDTYADWANKVFDWMDKSPLISNQWEVFDSISFTEQSCSTQPGPIQWTYNIGTLIAGSAYVRSLPCY